MTGVIVHVAKAAGGGPRGGEAGIPLDTDILAGPGALPRPLPLPSGTCFCPPLPLL